VAGFGAAFGAIMAFAASAPAVTATATSSVSSPPTGTGWDGDYARDLKPLFQERCYACHGALKQKAGLRLDTVEAMKRGGDSGPALVPGRPDKSPVLGRASATESKDRMPPEHEGSPLSVVQVEQVRRWIAAGAPSPVDERPESDPREHWAFRPRQRPGVPKVAAAGWVRNPIDAFVARDHEMAGVQPEPEADRLIQVRRLYLDLLGLPPTRAEAEEFERDGTGRAYERTVERLLNDPRHGERWARHWMDIWRYSDPWGLGDQHRNSQPHLWHWRDWIVESLNTDRPYDEMIRQMLAADELYPTDPERLRATGFLVRNYFLFNRNQWLDETVEHVGKGLLGLTLNCTKCHDHKYDPIAQVDYYRMRAFFEPYQARVDIVPGEADLAKNGLPRAYDRTLDPPTYRFVRGQETVPDKAKLIAPGVPALLGFAEPEIRPVKLPAESWQPERRPWVYEAYREAAHSALTRAQEKLAQLRHRSPSVPPLELAVAQAAVAVVERESAGVERRFDALRAEWSGAAREVLEERRLTAVQADREVAGARAALAVAEAELRVSRAEPAKREAVDKELAAARKTLADAESKRSAPIADTETFVRPVGTRWTATRFLDSTKDDPVVDPPSESTGRRTALASWIVDPRNPLTARVAANHLWARHFGVPLVPNVFDFGRKNPAPIHAELLDWLASELVDSGWSLKHLHRLIVNSAVYRLGSSGRNAEGSLAKDPDNLHWWRRPAVRIEAQVVRDSILAHAGRLDPAMGGPPVPPGAQSWSRRRSLYFQHSNNDRNAFLAAFDDATVKECYRREQSVVPQQALALMNDAMVHEAAGWIAERLARGLAGAGTGSGASATSANGGLGEDAFVREAFVSLLGFRPGETELAAAREAMVAWSREKRELVGTGESRDSVRRHLVWALLNHNDFVTLR
jgi:hypothetical protein